MKALKKSALREVRNSLGRYLAILAIVALGVGFFSGLRVCRDAMIQTGDEYLTAQQMFDYRLISTLAFSREDPASFGALAGVVDAEGSFTKDALFEVDGALIGVLKAHALTERLNLISLVLGRMPAEPGELIADAKRFGPESIGATLRLSPENDADTLAMFACREYTIVGLGHSPLYLNYERGSTELGNGTVAGFVYLPPEGFDCDYFTEIYVRCDAPGTIYSDAYVQAVSLYEDALQDQGEACALARYERIVADAEGELADGQAEYDEGFAEYWAKRADAEQALDEALDQLIAGKGEIAENERKIVDGNAELEDARAEYASSERKLSAAKTKLNESESATYAQLDATQAELAAQLAAAQDGVAQFEQSGVREQYTLLTQSAPTLTAGIQSLADARVQVVGAGDELRGGIAQAQAGMEALRAQEEQALIPLQAQQATLAGALEALESELAGLAPGDEARIAALESLLVALRTEKARAGEALAAAEAGFAARIADATSAKSALDAQAAQAQADIEALESEHSEAIGALEGELASITSALSAAEAERAALDPAADAAQIAALDDKISALSSQRATFEGQISSAKAACEMRIADAQAEKAACEEQVAQAASTLAALQAERDAALDALRAKCADADAAILAAEDELAGLAPSPHAARIAQLTAQIATKQQELAALAAQILAASAEFDAQRAAAEATKDELERQLAEYEMGLAENLAQIDAQHASLSAQLTAVQNGLRQIEEGGYPAKYEQLRAAIPQLEAGLAELAAQRAVAEGQFAAARDELRGGRTQLANARSQIEGAAQTLADGQAQLQDARSELADGHAEYDAAKAEAETEFANAAQELAEAAQTLQAARAQIDQLERPEVYALDRTANVGYACFESDAQIVAGISAVFPLFFFMVAALVCMTTMTRMVDEQRTQIGVLKALGYAPGSILRKYVFYSGSAALFGSLIGFFGGCVLFPKVIWMAYDIMYGFSELTLVLDWRLGATSLAAALLCAVGATWFSVRRDLALTPASLMRPQAPKAGKRILLERVRPLWQRLTFLQKVAIRNIFRYKKRLVMMIIGIGGCTALLVTGLGIRDSIADVVDYQFDEITRYDLAVRFTQAQDAAQQAAFLQSAPEAAACLFVHEGSAEVSLNGVAKSVSLIATDAQDISAFIDLHDGGARVALPGPNEAIVSRGLQELTGADVGDSLLVRDGDMRTMRLTISGVFDNYVFNYIYVREDTCRALWGYAPQVKTAYVNVPAGADPHEAAARIAGCEGVGNVSVNLDIRQRIDSMMKSLDYIVMLIVFSAGALAFIVLYNLTNINITERVREIATIKVLGFYPKETASYVFSENLLLCMLSALAGLPLGKLLHAFVLSHIRIDMMHFDVRVAPLSYLLAIVLTFVFAGMVNFVLRFKLGRINMAESLKAAE